MSASGRSSRFAGALLSTLLLVWTATPATAAEVTDPGAAGDGFVRIALSTDNLSGAYQMGIAIVLPSGVSISSSDLDSLSVTAILCSAAGGAGSCGSRTSLGNPFTSSKVGATTAFIHGHGTQAGGWCGSQCYVDLSTVQLQSGASANSLFWSSAWNAIEVLDPVTVDTVDPTDWPEDWYVSAGAPPAHEGPALVLTAAGGKGGVSTLTLVRAGAGNDVTCGVQDGETPGPDEYAGTVDGSGEFEFTHTWTENGSYNVWCDWDGSEFEQVRLVVNIGTGLTDIVDDESCGAWYNIACHIVRALEFVFVPSDLEGSISTLIETAGDAFPFSLAVDLVEAVTEIADTSLGTSTPSISIPLGLSTLTFNFPETSGSPGTVCSSSDGLDACGSWDSGIQTLWGWRTAIRGLLEVGLYLGVAFALYRRFSRAVEASS